MARFKQVDDARIPYTPEEEATADANDAAALAVAFPNAKAAFIKQVDQDADDIIKSVMGERATEYLLAEQEATAFAAGSYSGIVPGSVSSEATAKGVTAQVACNTILATAAGWRTAQAALRANRLLAKASAQTGQLDTVKASWSAFTAALKAQLGV